MPTVLPFKSKQEKIKDTVNLIAATAYESYIKMGRGAFIYEPAPFASAYHLTFFESGNPRFESILGEDLPELERMIGDYEPEIEFICVFVDEVGFEVIRFKADTRRTLREDWELAQAQREQEHASPEGV